MDRSIFLLPSDKITWNEIKAFLDQELEETAVLEYTQIKSLNDFEGVLESMGAMANTDGGIIIVGVSESKGPKKPNRPGGVTGIEAKWIDSLKNKCRSSLQPAWVPEMISIDIPGQNRVILLIRINPEQCPRPVVKRQDGVRVRVDNSNQYADLYRLQQLFASKNNSFGLVTSGISVSPDSMLTLSDPYDLLIRCALIGTGSYTSGFNTSIKEQVKTYLSDCSIQKLMRQYIHEVWWEYSSPASSHMLTIKSQNPSSLSSLPGLAADSLSINLRLHVSQPRVQQPGFVILDVLLSKLKPTGWYPLALTTLYEIIATGLATITNSSLIEQLTEMFSFWPNQFQAYVKSQVNPWLSLSNIHCVETLRDSVYFQAQADFSETDRISDIDRITKEWIGTLFADCGCLNYEETINLLKLPSYFFS